MIHETTKTALNKYQNYNELLNNIHPSDYEKLNGEPYNTFPNLPIVTLLTEKYIAYQGQYWILVQDIPVELYNLLEDLWLTPYLGYNDTYTKFEDTYQDILNGNINIYENVNFTRKHNQNKQWTKEEIQRELDNFDKAF